jgi:periplasmic protein TonB
MAFEGILEQPDARPGRFRRWMLGLSLGLHGAALVAGAIHSIWQVDELPMPQVQVSLVADVPPPPPPPPPPARKSSTKPKTKPVEAKPQTLTIPEKTDKPPEPEPAKEESQDNGVEGGVEGGVAGGVLGGVVGNTPPPPPPKDTGPKMVPANMGRKQLLIDPNSPAYQPKVPRALADSGQTFTARMQICVSAAGAVTSVRITKGANPAIDAQLPGIVRRWRYRPMTADGKPIAFCYPTTYLISGR